MFVFNSNMNDFIDYVKENQIKNIIILSGAGVSTNSGIPDYRSSDSIFTNLNTPETIFNNKNRNSVNTKQYLNILKNKMAIARPTNSHLLGKKLYDMGILKRIYTQNIDGLYSKAGLPDDKVVEFHGSFKNNNIVFYGDPINDQVLKSVENDLIKEVEEVDLLLVMGTSLQVSPFCALPNMVRRNCCRVLVDKCSEKSNNSN